MIVQIDRSIVILSDAEILARANVIGELYHGKVCKFTGDVVEIEISSLRYKDMKRILDIVRSEG